jgi:two-component system chemotaxis response regulator CheY
VKVLLVEPSATLRRALRNVLTSLAADPILVASDGVRALELTDSRVDLVITEWTLPTMSGLELVKRLRANPELSKVPVLMLTGRNGKDDVLEALNAGVNGYLLKPFTSDALRNSILGLSIAMEDEKRAA